jgi:hypothetical protein
VRAGFSNAEAVVTNAQSVDFIDGTPATISVSDAAALSGVIGTTPAGRFVYLWGRGTLRWGWVRASVDSITTAANTVRITPRPTHGGAVRFAAAPIISLEEAISIYHDSAVKSVRRTTATQMSNLTSPTWAPANELATNITSLKFTYYDGNNEPIVPSTLANRAAVRRVDAEVTGQTSAALSKGKREKYVISLTSVPRNMQMR